MLINDGAVFLSMTLFLSSRGDMTMIMNVLLSFFCTVHILKRHYRTNQVRLLYLRQMYCVLITLLIRRCHSERLSSWLHVGCFWQRIVMLLSAFIRRQFGSVSNSSESSHSCFWRATFLLHLVSCASTPGWDLQVNSKTSEISGFKWN